MRNVILCGALAIAAAVASRGQTSAQLVWRGQIDGPTILRISGDRVDVEDNSGNVFSTPDYRFTNPLPSARQNVQVLVREGRANARVLEQPRPNNNYTAVVEVTPRRQFTENVLLEMYWDPNSQFGAYEGRRGGNSNRGRGRFGQNAGPGSLSWSGRVDQDAVIEIRNGDVHPMTLRGQPVSQARADFSGALPRRDATFRLEDARGRGSVQLIEQPSPQNNYTAKVRIRDEQSGAGDYSFVLAWDDPYALGDWRQQQPVYGRYPNNQNLGYGGEMRWSGQVDGKVQVNVQGSRTWVTRVTGGPVYNQRSDFNGSFNPRNSDNVSVRKLSGRGDVRVVEYPSANNGYRLVFEIDDSSVGSDNYEVEVTW